MGYPVQTRRDFLMAAAAMGLGAAVGGSRSAWANDQEFSAWLRDLRREAGEKGISGATLDAALGDIQPLSRVIELDRRQPEFTLTFEEYLGRTVSQGRIDKGRGLYAQHRDLLRAVEQAFGVQARFLVAFWGIETDFGRVEGGFNVVEALATLAYDGRRSSYFRGELMNALRIIEEGNVEAKRMRGSWAGAMGQCQFMPSTFVNYAIDYDGDGKRDIWTSLPDVFGSAANYLSKSGWRMGETWGRRVRLPGAFDRALVDPKVKKPLADWVALGVKKADGGPLMVRDLDASVVWADTKRGLHPHLIYENFRTILKWNRSNFFAIAVGSLADAIGGG